jgi:hypothetical protein
MCMWRIVVSRRRITTTSRGADAAALLALAGMLAPDALGYALAKIQLQRRVARELRWRDARWSQPHDVLLRRPTVSIPTETSAGTERLANQRLIAHSEQNGS